MKIKPLPVKSIRAQCYETMYTYALIRMEYYKRIPTRRNDSSTPTYNIHKILLQRTW